MSLVAPHQLPPRGDARSPADGCLSLCSPDSPTHDAVMLLGPTASGKSAIAMSLAERFEIEIISVDSALVYRGMDIGTAKPTPAELAAVPHHLIDLLEPIESYSAASFVRDARQLIGEIRGRGRLPLLVGGTMLYARALATGLDDLPGADPAMRAALDEEAAYLGWPAMHARLATIDPQTAARLEPGDSQRIQRALEIHALSGRPMSELIGAPRAQTDAPLALLTIALEPADRAALHARIAARFEAMLAAGFLDEVAALRARGDLHTGMPSMRCVGYRQAWRYLDDLAQGIDQGAHHAKTGPSRRQVFIDESVAATRQLAKRQLTWLRSMPQRRVIDCLAPDASDQVAALIALAFSDQKTKTADDTLHESKAKG
jgi:tRNA dimethylallyltransferase